MKTTCGEKNNSEESSLECRALIGPQCHLTAHTRQLQRLLRQESVIWW